MTQTAKTRRPVFWISRFERPARLYTPRGFTLVELLVVVAIIGVTAAISFPFLGSLTASSQVSSTANRINGALSVARAYATAASAEEEFGDVTSLGLTARDDGDGYSGAAVLITPSNEVRLIQNINYGVDSSGNNLELYPGGVTYNAFDFIGSVDAFALPLPGGASGAGSRQAEVDDARYPDSVAVFGILLNNTANPKFILLPPPFAIRFDTRGRITVVEDYDLSWSSTFFTPDKIQQKRFVYYDGNRDGVFEPDADRASAGGERIGDYGREVDETRIGDEDGRIHLPFDRIEPVIGVVIINRDAIPYNEIDSSSGPTNNAVDFQDFNFEAISEDDTADILKVLRDQPQEGRVILFNRYTGVDVAS